MAGVEHISREAQDAAVRISSCVKRAQDFRNFAMALDNSSRKLMTMDVLEQFHDTVALRARNRVETDFGPTSVVVINGRDATADTIKHEFNSAVQNRSHLVLIKFLHLLAPVETTRANLQRVEKRIRELLACADRLTDLECQNISFIGLVDNGLGLNTAVSTYPLVEADTGAV